MTFLLPRSDDFHWMGIALSEAARSYRDGGIPVGAVLVEGGKLIASGSNRSIQSNDPTSHGEIDCLRNAGVAANFAQATLYTTLSPCSMCAGAISFLGIRRLVVGERTNYLGEIEALMAKQVGIVLLHDPSCVDLLSKFIADNPQLWARTLNNS